MADKSSPARGGGPPAKPVVEGAELQAPRSEARPLHPPPAGPPPRAGEDRVRTVLAAAATHLAPISTTPRLDAEQLTAHAAGLAREALLPRPFHDPAPPRSSDSSSTTVS